MHRHVAPPHHAWGSLCTHVGGGVRVNSAYERALGIVDVDDSLPSFRSTRAVLGARVRRVSGVPRNIRVV